MKKENSHWEIASSSLNKKINLYESEYRQIYHNNNHKYYLINENETSYI
jgi:hypothetical protein